MMRPTVGVKPQERIVLYTDLPSNIQNPNTGLTLEINLLVWGI